MKETADLISQVPVELLDKLERIAQKKHISLDDVTAHLLEKILVQKEQPPLGVTKLPPDLKTDNS